MTTRYSPAAQRWLDNLRAVELATSSTLIDNGVDPLQAMKVASELAPELLAKRMTPRRINRRSFVRKSAVVRPVVPHVMAFCANERQAVRLSREKRMSMGGFVGTCPLCNQIHYRDDS